MIEAGRAALPIIASDISPHCEIVNASDEGENGRRLYPTGNVDQLAELFSLVGEHLEEEQRGAKDLAQELDARYAPPVTAEVHESAYLTAQAARRTR